MSAVYSAKNRQKSHAKLSIVVAVAGTFLALIYFTVPLSNTTILAKELSAGPTEITWMISSTSLGLAAALIVAGSLGDDLGRRRIFLSGTFFAALGALLSASAAVVLVGHSAWIFIGGRFVQGLGVAAMVACSAALIVVATSALQERINAMALWGAAPGLGIASGSPLGAVLAGAGIWWLAYLLMAAAAFALIWWGHIVLEESRAAERKPVDIPAAILIAVALGLALYGLTAARTGWGRADVILSLAAAVILLSVLVGYQLRQQHPMIDPRIFRLPGLPGAAFVALITGAGAITIMSYMAVVFTQALGQSAVVIAAIGAIWPVTSILTALLMRKVPAAISGGARFVIGLVLTIVGFLPWALITVHVNYVVLSLGLVVAGAGSGIINATLGKEAVEYLPIAKAGMGSGLNNTLRYVGSALGVTIFVGLAVPGGSAHSLISGWNTAVWLAEGMALVAILVVLLTAYLQRRQSAVQSGKSAIAALAEQGPQ